MADQSYAYDHAQYQVHVPATVYCPAVAAGAMSNKFVAFNACKVKSIRGNTNITGTAAAALYQIKNGTTSFAIASVGTNAIGTDITVTMSEQTLAAGGTINFTAVATDGAVMSAVFTLEIETIPGANVTV